MRPAIGPPASPSGGDKVSTVDGVTRTLTGDKIHVRVRWIVTPGSEENLSEVVVAISDETASVRAEQERERLIEELRAALAKVKVLSGLLPICSGCKDIRDDDGYWQKIERYISAHSQAEFTHGLCPECEKRLYPDHA